MRLSLAELQVAVGGYAAHARQHFEPLRKRQAGKLSVLFGLARCIAAQGEQEQALQLLDRLLDRNPHDWKASGERLAGGAARPPGGRRKLPSPRRSLAPPGTCRC